MGIHFPRFRVSVPAPHFLRSPPVPHGLKNSGALAFGGAPVRDENRQVGL